MAAALWIGLLCVGFNPALIAADSALSTPPLKVMSFNIRYGSAQDGTNSWPARRHLVLETIRLFDPDLLGLQEAVGFQVDFLRENLPHMSFHGAGRDDGQQRGEYVPVFFRTRRFAMTDSGHFWLSTTPETPGSRGWDAQLPRMVSWVLVEDRLASYRPFVFANTHFDHRGPQARIESARLIRQQAGALLGQMPAILTGDFNCTEDDNPYAILVGGQEFGGERAFDTYRVIHPQRFPDEVTFNGWAHARAGKRIDWIVHTPGWITLNAFIDYTNDGGRLPSDHYPVGAVLRLQP